MNFLSHFYLDRDVEDSPFIVGVSTPDLVSLYSREIRIKHLPILPIHTPHYISFTQGIQRHVQADKVFHSSDFFEDEVEKIGDFLKLHFKDVGLKRSFFVAHVLVELMIDKVLISQDKKLIPDFYAHLQSVGPATIVGMTQMAVAKDIDPYFSFIQKFLQNQYLYHYSEYEYILYVLQRIVRRVGIEDVEYLKSDILRSYLIGYEEELKTRVDDLFSYMHLKM